MTVARKRAKNKSNNPANPNQNICGQAVARYLNCHKEVRYLHYMEDIVRACRKRWTVRSRGSKVKGKSVGSQRKKFAKLAENMHSEARIIAGFIIRVKGHVLFLNPEGKTIVDTAPRQRDRRKITHAYIVYK